MALLEPPKPESSKSRTNCSVLVLEIGDWMLGLLIIDM
jgi:hypothetical protein